MVRNIVWDNLHGYSLTTPIDDVDVIYYDELSSAKEHDLRIETELKESLPNLVWSVKIKQGCILLTTMLSTHPLMMLYQNGLKQFRQF